MGPRSHGPSDGEGASARRELDAGWDEVLSPSETSSPPARSAADEPRAAAEDAPADAGPRVAESSSVDLSTATLEQESTEPDQRVERESSTVRAADAMMSGSWGMATRDASAPSVEAAAISTDRGLRDSDAEMAAIMGTRESDDASISSATLTVTPALDASAKPGVQAPRVAVERPSSRVTLDGDEPPLPSTRPKTGPAGLVRPATHAPVRRMASSEPRTLASRASAIELGGKPKRLSLGWAVVAGVGIAGIAWVFGGPMRTQSPGTVARPTTDAKVMKSAAKATGDSPGAAAPATKPNPESGLADVVPPPVLTPREEVDAETHTPTEPEPKITPAPPKPVEESLPKVASETPATRGVRTPPPRTPPEIAATFVRLPVSPADLPPVGGVGNSGIHVDRIEMGASYDNKKTGCVGVAKQFSLAANEEINVCLRVVHPRQEEVMSIVWQKADGTTARRGKIAVKPIHGYRTRAYLRLRAEYIGAWTVRITSPDGVELASHAFTITP